MHLLRKYNKKYLGYTDYEPSVTSLGKSLYGKYLLLSMVGKDIRANALTQCTATEYLWVPKQTPRLPPAGML